MFTNPLQTGSSIQDTINKLMSQVDTDQDGSISTQEFGAFLTSLLTSQTSTDGSTGTTGTGSTSTTGGGSTTTSAGSSGGSTGTSGPSLAAASTLRFEGFDLMRAQDPASSAKDAFAEAAAASGTMPSTKAGAEQWFEQHIRASMESRGHAINWVKGDKLQFTNWQGTWEVDFVRGADGPDPALAWQATPAAAGPILTDGTTPTGTTPTGTTPALDPNMSLQAAFDQLARASGTIPQTKPDAESWFNQHIRSGLESLGIAINWVIGDKFEYAGPNGPVVIDFIVGAGGPNPQLGWLVE